MSSNIFDIVEKTPERVQAHGLAAYIYRSNKAQSYKSSWQEQFLVNSTYLKLESELSQLFKNNNIAQFTALKGLALFDDIYEDIATRSISDIDILVRREDRERIESLLRENDYKHVRAREWRGNHFKCSYSKFIHGIELVVELHTALFVFRDFVDFKYRKHNNRIMLDHADQLFHLIVHLSHQHTFLKLSWLLDIKLYLEKYRQEINFERFDYLARHLKLERSCALTLALIQREFLIKTETSLKLSRHWLLKLLSHDVLMYPIHGHNRFRYFLIKTFQKDSIMESFKYSWLWLWQGGWIKNN